jgi:hypothetical protein
MRVSRDRPQAIDFARQNAWSYHMAYPDSRRMSAQMFSPWSVNSNIEGYRVSGSASTPLTRIAFEVRIEIRIAVDTAGSLNSQVRE